MRDEESRSRQTPDPRLREPILTPIPNAGCGEPCRKNSSAGIAWSLGSGAWSLLRRFHWRSFAFGVAVPLAVAFCFGPKYTAYSEDPLMGRRKHEANWLGVQLYNRIEENEVSKWADGCSVPQVYPAQFGWNVITRTSRGWFTGTTLACGGGYGIPGKIFRREIVIDGQTPEETLRTYQNESIEAYFLHGSTEGVQKRWVKSFERAN